MLIIGVDLLSHYGLLVDCRNNRLLDGVNSLTTPDLIASASVPSIKVIAVGTPPDSLFEQFPGMTSPTGIYRGVHHNTTHHICFCALSGIRGTYKLKRNLSIRL